MKWLLIAIAAVLIFWLFRPRPPVWIYPGVWAHATFGNVNQRDLALDLRSWGEWLDHWGKVVVRLDGTDNEVEFRKCRYKNRSDVLVFRYRNADATRKYFDQVRGRFDAGKVDYELEFTKKLRKPSAIAVAMHAADPLMPVTAIRLLIVAFGIPAESGASFTVEFCGSIRPLGDAPRVALSRESYPKPYLAGVLLGYAIGRVRGVLAGRKR